VDSGAGIRDQLPDEARPTVERVVDLQINFFKKSNWVRNKKPAFESVTSVGATKCVHLTLNYAAVLVGHTTYRHVRNDIRGRRC